MENNQIPQKRDILIVDDTPANLQVLTQLLSEQGYRVRPAPSGSMALKSAQLRPPDLILLDIMMPGMDGYEVCRQLKAHERTRDVPVIFLSALSETLNKTRAFNSGAVDYITKPFQAEEVLARVKTHLTLYGLQQYQRDLFARFANREVVDEIMTHGFNLGGRNVDAAALFADIRSFTSITESQPPQDTIELLNDYFDVMFGIVAEEGGIVAQIVGDGIMCIFGAPVPREDYSLRAVRAAAQMMNQITQFNQRRAAQKKQLITIGIGIASGKVVAGLVGAQNRAIYTCHGDPVNTAARLEEYTKTAGRPVLMDERTRLALGTAFTVDDLGPVTLRGKVEPVHLFALAI
ncbi:MAG: response regulator [Candidatus Promineifilaceae bacterium]|nr:response regulator [Candidatus Promineifilaceae bacterium]